MTYEKIKRIIDLLFALGGVLLLSPVLIFIAIWVKLESAGPVLFRQLRYGRNQVPFECLKFRTMYEDTPPNSPTSQLQNSHSYITFSGKILRRLGLDELPQLFNIIKGDMSHIGPRPVILAEKDLIAEREKYGANAMVPGIGGWAQSNGRDEIDYKIKARLDGEYAQNFGIAMDISCLWRTAVAIFTSDGFKEGAIGDTAYKRMVQKNTHRIGLRGRIVRRVKKDVTRLKEQPKQMRAKLAKSASPRISIHGESTSSTQSAKARAR